MTQAPQMLPLSKRAAKSDEGFYDAWDTALADATRAAARVYTAAKETVSVASWKNLDLALRFVIEERAGKWVLLTKDRQTLLGRYDTRGAALARARALGR